MKPLSAFLTFLTIFLFASCHTKTDKAKQKDELKPSSSYITPIGDTTFFALLNLDFPGMEDVKKYVGQSNLIGAKNAYLDFRRKRSKTKWHIDPLDKPKTAIDYSTIAADRVMEHYVRMGSYNGKEAFLGEDINWDTNPLVPSDPDYDTQFSHSLHRLGFWNTLGQAYWATLDEKYAKEWVYQMTDWVKDNPVDLKAAPGKGSYAWWSLNPGIRMSDRGSWMNAYYYFLFSPHLTPESHYQAVKSIIEHGWRLKTVTLEYPNHVGNWVTMECNGLGTIGILFPEIIESEEFIKVAFDRMNDEIDQQVYPDGSQVELAPGYHQVSLNNFMDLVRVAQLNNIALPEGYLEKLRKMYEFNLYLMDPSGALPPFNDSGRSQITNSLKEAYDIWNDSKFLFGATLGKEGQKPENDSYFFNYAGYYVMRSGWNLNDNCMFFDAGPVGLAHQHEDMLNLYLYYRGKIVLTEAGSYSYDQSEWRRYSLSTPAHNTIIVDGKEQHRSDIQQSRLIKEPLTNPWLTTDLFDYGAGTYSSGYQNNEYVPVQYMPKKYIGEKDTSISHTRHIVFLKPYYYVTVDFLEGTGVHTYDAHFHLDAPDARIEEESLVVQSLRKDSIQLGLYPMDIENLRVKIVQGQENPILGWLPRENRPIPAIIYSKKEEAPATFSTLIYPYYISQPEVSYKKIMAGDENIWGESINTPYETALIILNKKPEKNVEIEAGVESLFNTNAEVSVVRKLINNPSEFLGFYKLSEYSDKTLSLKTGALISLLIVKKDNIILIYNPMEDDCKINFTLPVKTKFTLQSKKWINISSSGISKWNEAVTLF